MNKKLANCLLILVIFSGCAPKLFLQPTHLDNRVLQNTDHVISLTNDVDIVLASRYSRKLQMGTKCKFVGAIKEGKVFKPIGTVFTIEGAHVHEAYLVIKNNQLVGFYIPGENSFSPLGSSVSIPYQVDDK